MEEKLDNIMEDLIVGHNFEYAREALLNLFAEEQEKLVRTVIGEDESLFTDISKVSKEGFNIAQQKAFDKKLRNGLRFEQRQRFIGLTNPSNNSNSSDTELGRSTQKGEK